MNEIIDVNLPDKRGIHPFRFKWKKAIDLKSQKIKQVWLKMDSNYPRFFFELNVDDDNVMVLNEIININIIKKIEKLSKKFKVIGAKGRNIIIGEIKLAEFEIPGKLLILTSLLDWRMFDKFRK